MCTFACMHACVRTIERERKGGREERRGIVERDGEGKRWLSGV